MNGELRERIARAIALENEGIETGDIWRAYLGSADAVLAELAAELAPPSRSDEGSPTATPQAEPVATSCADHFPGETGYATFHARVPSGAKLYAAPPRPQASAEDLALLDDAFNAALYSMPDVYEAAWQRLKASLGVK